MRISASATKRLLTFRPHWCSIQTTTCCADISSIWVVKSPKRCNCRELDVRYALTGSVLPDGERLRVNAKLLDAQTGTQLWAERFDVERNDILQVQDEIVARLARAIGLKVIDVEGQRTERERPKSTDPGDRNIGAGSRIKEAAIMQLYNNPDVVPSIGLNQYPADMKADWSAVKRTPAPASE